MNPFFFGNSKAPLYGVFHWSDHVPTHGVVLCSAFGQEYMRSHRAMRQLATMLSRNGIPALRFDYRGTGDSAGELEEATADQWIEDIHIAIDELKETANIKTVSVIGLRLGCLFATHTCAMRHDVSRLILWDPIVSGNAYIDELKTEIKLHPENIHSNFIAHNGTLHYNGFALSKTFQNSLKQLDLAKEYPSNISKVIQIVSSENDRFSTLSDAWQDKKGFEYQHIEAPGDWNFVDDNGGILLPQPIIQGIVNQYKTTEAA